MDEDNATAVIGAKETVISFYQFSLFVVFGSFCRFFIVFWVFVCRLVQDPHEPVIEGEQYFLEGVIVEGMYCFFLVFVVAVELEGQLHGRGLRRRVARTIRPSRPAPPPVWSHASRQP